MKILRIINLLVITLTITLISFCAAVFYLGNLYTYEKLIEELPISFFKRFIGFWILIVLFSAVVFLVNWILSRSRIVKVENGYPLRIGTIAFLIGTISVLLGTTIFFSS